jgi:hypothetical protein
LPFSTSLIVPLAVSALLILQRTNEHNLAPKRGT